MQREMILFRGATMPRGRMAYLGRHAEGPSRSYSRKGAIKAMTWMGYVATLLLVVPGLTT